MRIAYLCKRRYMSKDVILDRYARLYEIPRQLALRGHEVHAWCLGYRNEPDGEIEHAAEPGRLLWHARGLGRMKLPGIASYPFRVLHALRRMRPDVLIGASDIPHVALTAWLSRRLRVPYAVDLYDNFEGFGQARLPGMVRALRSATRDAGLVITTSEPLRELVVDDYRAHGKVIAMPSSVDKSVFRPLDKSECREALGLPHDARLVGTAGGLSPDKGVDALYEAWPLLRERYPDVHLVLAGPYPDAHRPPIGDRIHYLGSLPHHKIAQLFCALDVGVICVRDTVFGRYCFPQKAYEMLACGLAVVAADVGAMGRLLADHAACLFRAEDPDDLAQAVGRQLDQPFHPSVRIDDWEQLLGRIEPEISRLRS